MGNRQLSDAAHATQLMVTPPATASRAAPVAPWIADDGARDSRWFGAGLLFLLAPAALVLVMFSPRLVGVATLLATLFCVWCLRDEGRVAAAWPAVSLRPTWPLLLVAGGAVWLSGVLPPFAENLDWYKHYGLFNDLLANNWPPLIPLDDRLATLRYSLAYYVVPAGLARCFGAALLPWAIFAWTTAGLYGALLLAFGAARASLARRFWMPVVFLLFSGADVLGFFLTGTEPKPVLHLEWWARFGELASGLTNLIWTPQHALSGWIATFLILAYPRRALSHIVVLGAAVAMWSPFCAIGILPLACWAVARAGGSALLSRSNLLAGPVLLLAAAAFLLDGAGGIPASMIWHTRHFSALNWAAFVVLEFGAICVALVLARRQDAGLIALAAAALMLLCCFGVGANNDLLMRGSIPTLAVLAVLAARAVTGGPGGMRTAPLVLCLVVGSVTPMGEILRAVLAPRIVGREQLSVVDVMRTTGFYLAPQYLRFNPPGIDYAPVTRLAQLQFTSYGDADFDLAQHRVSAAGFTDSGIVSNTLVLAPGLYRIEAVVDGAVSASQADSHAAHLSIHGRTLAIAIPAGRYADSHVNYYFHSDGRPVQLAFGLGGWTRGQGSISLKQLTVSRISRRWYW